MTILSNVHRGRGGVTTTVTENTVWLFLEGEESCAAVTIVVGVREGAIWYGLRVQEGRVGA